MRPEVILFDLDDTLFDHRYSSRCGLEAVLNKHASFLRLTLDTFEQDYLSFLDKVWPRVLQGQISLEQSRIERFQLVFQKYGLQLSDIDGLTLSACYRAAYQDQRRAIVGSIALLESMKQQRVQIGVVSNGILQEQQEKLEYCNLKHMIDFLIVSEQVGAAKPEALIFETALRYSRCDVQRAVMVGDSWHADILGARALGIRAIWFNALGVACPDSSLASELRTYSPLESVIHLLLGD